MSAKGEIKPNKELQVDSRSLSDILEFKHVPAFLLVILTILYSLPFLQLPLQADDEMYIFRQGDYYWNHLPEVIHTTLSSARYDFNGNGRLVFLAHFFGIMGLVITTAFQRFFSMNGLLAYSFTGLILNCLLGLTSMRVLKQILIRVTKSTLVLNRIQILFAIIFPISIISNKDFAGFRLIYWNYTFEVAYSLFLISILLKCKDLRGSHRRITVAFFVSLGFLLGNEITQFFGVVAILLYVSLDILSLFIKDDVSGRRRRFSLKLMLTVFMRSTFLIYVTSFFGLLLAARFHAHKVCPQVDSCYAPGNVNLSHWNISSGITGIINSYGNLPPFSQLYWFTHSLGSERKLNLLTGATIFSVLVFVLVNQILKSLFKNGSVAIRSNIDVFPIFLMLFAIIGLSGFMQSTIVASQSHSITFADMGKSDRSITLLQPIIAIILTLILFMLLRNPRFSRSIYVGTLVALLSLSVLNFWINSSVSFAQRVTPDFRIESMISNELVADGITPIDNRRRCDLFKEKIKFAKRWMGHDRTVYEGLNAQYYEQFKVPFCDIKPDEMFKDY